MLTDSTNPDLTNENPSGEFHKPVAKTSEYLLEISDFWENFANKATSNKFMVTEPMIKKVQEYFWNLSWKIWVDYWCWIWDVTNEFSNLWAKMIWIDISPDQLSKAKDKYGHLDFIDKIDSIEDESVNFVYFKFSLCAMDDEAYIEALKDVYKKLKKEWVIVIWDQNRDECIGKETFCEYYPAEESIENWHKRKTILKIWGKKMSEWLEKWIDYQEVTDYFRSQEYTKSKLEEVWFSDVEFNFPKIEDPSWDVMDEKDIKIYKITTAKKW